MKKYDKAICDAWKDDIEKLLIFAALFSATVTAFTVESYQWLQEDYTQTSALLLAQISLQVNAIANNINMMLPDPRIKRCSLLRQGAYESTFFGSSALPCVSLPS
ncbi:hypothetical protein AMATHDRAFT_156374 [Amanita thiersii Skay4041]|uniref:DUF6535 domain-containing protein n=1 Tax=Amanita thiersii Skay4041 TaxID=703135 RepID=A0A2A9N734_9AGAR|nr:hypothetical protein AMATHDRAFT_156374 [Amanita thiersii Skay4041]